MLKSRITDMDKIRELLSFQNPNSSTEAVEDAMDRLKGYRKSEGIKSLIFGVVLLPIGVLAAIALKGGIIVMALIGALIGGGIGLIAKGIFEYFKMK